VNNRGVIGIVWNDRSTHQDPCYDLAFAASTDGGETFSASVGTGREPTCPQATANWLLRVSTYYWSGKGWGDSREGEMLDVLSMASRFLNGGDTQGLDSDDRGVFYAGWIDGSRGAMQLAVTNFTVGAPGTRKAVAVAANTRAPTLTVEAPSPLHLIADDCKVDWTAKTFICDVRLKNVSNAPIRGPYTLTWIKALANEQGVRTTNSENDKTGEDAIWTIPAPSGGMLAPGASTQPKRIVWTLREVPDPLSITLGFLFSVKGAAR
jgi:hypothetical protein